MSDGYNKFANNVKNVHVVNDLAERGIKLISDFIDKSQDEEQIQALLHVVEWHRAAFPDYTKSTLQKLTC